MLATVLHQYPFVNAWLTMKVLLLVVYVVLGVLRSSAARRVPRAPGVSSPRSLVFGFIISVARAHDPRGVFALLGL